MNVDLVFAIFAGILLVVGFIGTFVPVLPGAPLAWLGLLLAFFSDYCKISISGLIIAGIFAVLVSVLDNFFPVFLNNLSFAFCLHLAEARRQPLAQQLDLLLVFLWDLWV